MREHEVPTHVQAEDRVLLWFSFPQIVAMTAVCALSYGAYRYAPVGPSEVRIAIAVLLGLAGVVAVVGKVGGRRLPLVAADLLSYRLGARLHRGQVSQLVRREPPAPAQPDRSGPGPMRLMARKARRALRRRRNRERSGGRMPFRPHRWFGKGRRGKADMDSIKGKVRERRKDRRKKHPKMLAVAVVAALFALAATLPQAVLADDHEDWRDEIDFELTEPVDGRRVFVEGLTISGDRADVILRAATDIELRAWAFGGPDGSWLRFWGAGRMGEGESVEYSLPLHGPAPSFTFSWEDSLGQAGAVTVPHERIPYPLPEIEGELCDLRLVSLGWRPRGVRGVIESECETRVEHPIKLQTVAGHVGVTETALMDAEVTGIVGTVFAESGASYARVAFVPNGRTSFWLNVPDGDAIHDVAIDVDVEASLRIAMPPLTRLIHHEERVEERTETVSLYRPGTSRTVSKTVTVTSPDGTTTEHVISARLSIPGRTVQKDVTLTIVHPEHVKAEVVNRSPISRSRSEGLSLASAVGSDDPYTALALPDPEPVDPPAEQMPAGGDPASGSEQALIDWFEQLGWDWPW